MSAAEIEDIRARYAAVSRGDRDAIFRDVHPDFSLKPPDRVPDARSHLDAAEATRFMKDMWSAFEEVSAETEEFYENGDDIVVMLHVRNRLRGSGAAVEIKVAALWSYRDGKPIRCEMFPERDKALAAAGLRASGSAAN